MKPRFSKWEWLVLALVLAVLLSALVGCSRGSVPGPGTPSVPGGPAAVLTRIALIATAVAGSCLVACAFLAVFYPNKWLVAKLAIACVAVIVGSQVVFWLGAHLVAVALAAGVLGLGYLGWRHLARLEKVTGVDFNRNGRLG